MFKFFRKIRQKLLSENKLNKYLIYAFGEIILVVIGILIALQINNWNLDQQTRKKEWAYLQEIRTNLQRDSLKLHVVLDFNHDKEEMAVEMLQIFVDSLTNEERFRIFNEKANDFTFFQVFDPVRIAFNNMLSAESIDLISNGELREAMSEYYNFPYLNGVQERLAVINRRVIDEHYPKFFTQEFVNIWMGFSSKMPPVSDLDIATDQQLMADLFGIKMIVMNQNELIMNTQKQNLDLLAKLNSVLKEK